MVQHIIVPIQFNPATQHLVPTKGSLPNDRHSPMTGNNKRARAPSATDWIAPWMQMCEIGAPRLVDDQRLSALMTDVGDRRQIRARTVWARTDDQCPAASGCFSHACRI
jgi:hypothetical protein